MLLSYLTLLRSICNDDKQVSADREVFGEFDVFRVELPVQESLFLSNMSVRRRSVGTGHQLLFYRNCSHFGEMYRAIC
jgi:hypothetical protein